MTNILRQSERTMRTRDEMLMDDFAYVLRQGVNAPPIPPYFMGKRLRKAYPGGLTGIPLEGTLKHLIAAPTPVSDSLASRSVLSMAGWNGATLQWRAITGMNTNGDTGVITSPDDPGSTAAYSSASYSTPMYTLGEQSVVYQDDIDDAIGYNDPLSDDVRMLAQIVKRQKELRTIYGNYGASNGGIDLAEVDLSGITPPLINGGTITQAHLRFMVVPLTGYAWANKDLSVGLNGSDTFEDKHYGPYNVAHHTVEVAPSSQSVLLTWSTPQTGASQPRQGAYAYAVFFSTVNAANPTAAQYNLHSVVGSIQSLLITSLPSGTRTLSELTNTAGNFAVAGFNGLLTQIDKTGSGAFVVDMGADANPTTPLGRLTSNGGLGITQIESAMLRFFLTNGLAPDVIWTDAGTKQDISNIITGSSPTTLRVQTTSGDREIIGGLVGGNGYLSRYADGLSNANNDMQGLPEVVPIRTSRDIPPGNIILMSTKLPFPVSNIPTAVAYAYIREMYVEQYAKTRRSWPHGVYWRGGLQLYYPAGCGLITNILPGPR